MRLARTQVGGREEKPEKWNAWEVAESFKLVQA